jgi:pimeloyl-ACP methyl ester carboxylesterase
MVHASIPDMKSQWSVERLSDFHVASVKFFTEREAYKVEDMRNISCPVQLVHCSDDIAYDLGTTNEVAKHLYTAGVDVKVSRIPGAPHFGACTHPTEFVKESDAL